MVHLRINIFTYIHYYEFVCVSFIDVLKYVIHTGQWGYFLDGTGVRTKQNNLYYNTLLDGCVILSVILSVRSL